MGDHEIGCLNHCPGGGGGHGKGGAIAVAALAVVILIAASSRKVRHGVDTGLHVLGVIFEVILWVAGISVGLLCLAGAIWAGFKIHAAIQARGGPQQLPERQQEYEPMLASVVRIGRSSVQHVEDVDVNNETTSERRPVRAIEPARPQYTDGLPRDENGVIRWPRPRSGKRSR